MTKTRGILLTLLAVALTAGVVAWELYSKPLQQEIHYNGPRPNFLFVVTDDQSWIHTSYAGYPAVQTPSFDRIAREGVYFENAFASAPSCTASRSAILTGRHFWELGSAGQLWGEFPDTLRTYQQILQAYGYKVGYSGKGWGPGYAPQGNPAGAGHVYNIEKRTVDTTLTAFDQVENLRVFLSEKPADQPFSYWVSPTEPHRPFKPGIGKESGTIPLDRLEVPLFLPDNEIIREDIADYLFEIQWFDEELGRILALLEQEGQLDNTVIVYTSDNGMPFPRAKSNNYDYGIRVPLAIRWGDQVKSHLDVTDLVSLVDIAPTFLELAQVPVPENMSGKSFVRQLLSKSPGRIDPQRNAVFSGFERHIGTARLGRRGYPSRAIRTDDYLYIRNFAPDRWPAGRPPTLDDIDSGSPTKTYLIAQRQEYEKHTLPDVKKEGDMSLGFLPQGNLSAVVNDPAQALTLMASKRPAEELYEVTRDPGQLNNVADNPDYAQIKEALAEQLAAEMERTGDPWSTGDGSIFDTYKYYAIDKPDKPVATIATEK